jgi:hypothetical protein
MIQIELIKLINIKNDYYRDLLHEGENVSMRRIVSIA